MFLLRTADLDGNSGVHDVTLTIEQRGYLVRIRLDRIEIEANTISRYVNETVAEKPPLELRH